MLSAGQIKYYPRVVLARTIPHAKPPDVFNRCPNAIASSAQNQPEVLNHQVPDPIIELTTRYPLTADKH
jgi:hypothetical protein